MPSFSRFSAAWFLLVLGVLLAGLSLIGRARSELAPSPVEIALEWGDAVRLSQAERIPLSQWLAGMRQSGAVGVTLDVQTVRELADDGRLTLWSRANAAPFIPAVKRLPEAYRFVVICRDVPLLSRVRASLNDGAGAFPPIEIAPGILASSRSGTSLASWPVGLDPASLQELRLAHLEPLARLNDWAGATPARLESVLQAVRRDGARIVVAGDPSPGSEKLLPQFARSLRRNGLSLAWVEGRANA